MLTFDEATHTYRWDGVVVHFVTQVIAPVVDYSAVPREVLAKKAEFGKAVHLSANTLWKGDWTKNH